MSLRPFYLVSIQQMTSFYKNGEKVVRDALIELDFVTSYEICKTWENHTDYAKVQFPKNVILKTDEFLFKQSGVYNVILGANTESDRVDDKNNVIEYPPLIMRGDMIYISAGYIYRNEFGKDVTVGKTLFKGFISHVESKIPIEIKCEDNFFLLKHVPLDVNIWGEELISLCKHICDLVNSKYYDTDNRYPKLSVTDLTDEITGKFALGHLEIGNMTCSQLLSQIKQHYHLDSFFRDDVLCFGYPTYDERLTNDTHVLEFENNIIDSSNLEFKNKMDIELSAVVKVQIYKKTGKKTQDGAQASKRENKSILVYWDLPSQSFKFFAKSKGEPFPKNEGGERHEFIYTINPNSAEPSNETLFEFGKLHLQKYLYNGFTGSLLTIGFPFINYGDNVNLFSKKMADRNGQYKVKKVIYSGGGRDASKKGLKQEIFLDYRVNVDLPTEFDEIYMI